MCDKRQTFISEYRSYRVSQSVLRLMQMYVSYLWIPNAAVFYLFTFQMELEGAHKEIRLEILVEILHFVWELIRYANEVVKKEMRVS
ncbi:hypothetical protein AB6A40_007958 [Gnathostoma spinigerum]|uniref:Uncharacterized protein n=1 Tax=Gnathostoma spinigerum TaxID=75299 RepID=A0ABD6ESV4_9BILA